MGVWKRRTAAPFRADEPTASARRANRHAATAKAGGRLLPLRPYSAGAWESDSSKPDCTQRAICSTTHQALQSSIT